MAVTGITKEQVKERVEVVTSVASAAFLSSGIGCLVIGLMTTGAEISQGFKDALNWWNPVGPLTGKTAVGVLAWLISWAILHFLWKDKEVDFNKTFIVTLVLIGLGFVFTFPPIFEAFAAE
jgi:hypothetical protein